jgi:hypothetical protein
MGEEIGMTRYWSEEDGKFIECEVVWDGRESLTDGDGWMQRYPPIVGGTEKGEHATRKETSGKGKPDVPFGHRILTDTGTGRKCHECGGWVTGVVANRCGKCRSKAHGRLPTSVPCSSCFKEFDLRLLTAKLRLCRECKKPKQALRPRYHACQQCSRPFTLAQMSTGIKKCYKGTGCRRKAQEAAA